MAMDWGEEYHRGDVPFPTHRIRGCMISICIIPGDGNLADMRGDVYRVSPARERYLVHLPDTTVVRGESLCLPGSSPQPRAGESSFASYREEYQRIGGLRLKPPP